MLQSLRVADTVRAPLTFASRWYILLTEPQQEQRAAGRLEDAGFEAYTPVITREVRAARGRKREIASALFPSYLFVVLTPGVEDWMGVRAIRGIRSFLQVDGCKAVLTAGAIAAIRAKEVALEARRQQRLARNGGFAYTLGQRVTVKIGPFTELLANVEAIDARGRIQVLLDLALLGRRSWPVELSHLSADVNH